MAGGMRQPAGTLRFLGIAPPKIKVDVDLNKVSPACVGLIDRVDHSIWRTVAIPVCTSICLMPSRRPRLISNRASPIARTFGWALNERLQRNQNGIMLLFQKVGRRIGVTSG